MSQYITARKRNIIMSEANNIIFAQVKTPLLYGSCTKLSLFY